jgi:colicin import membrane protein
MIDSYLKHLLDLQTRQAVALEAMAENSAKTLALLGNLQHVATADTTGTATIAADGNTAKVTPADTPTEEANEIARKSAIAAQAKAKADAAAKAKADAAAKAKADAAAKAAQADADAAAAAATAETTTKAAKAPSADEARAALKTYATINGNAAAMALLQQLGATSVSALPEDKRAELLLACQ